MTGKQMISQALAMAAILITATAVRAQFKVKNEAGTTHLMVSEAGKVGIGLGTTEADALTVINGSHTVSHPIGFSLRIGLLSKDLNLEASDSHIAIEGFTKHYPSDNNTARTANHGTLLDGNNTNTVIAAGGLGYQNYGTSTPWVSGVQGSLYSGSYTLPGTAFTAGGVFENGRTGTNDYGVFCAGKLGLTGGATSANGLITFGNTNVSISRNTDNNRLYITNLIGDIDLYADIIRHKGTSIHSSDRRLKTDISNLHLAMDSIEKLASVSFKWKDRPGDPGVHYGFIAQDVETVLPELVHTDDEGYKAIKYLEFIPILVNGLKELQAINQEQQREIENLKALIAGE